MRWQWHLTHRQRMFLFGFSSILVGIRFWRNVNCLMDGIRSTLMITTKTQRFCAALDCCCYFYFVFYFCCSNPSSLTHRDCVHLGLKFCLTNLPLKRNALAIRVSTFESTKQTNTKKWMIACSNRQKKEYNSRWGARTRHKKKWTRNERVPFAWLESNCLARLIEMMIFVDDDDDGDHDRSCVCVDDDDCYESVKLS